MQHYPVIIVGSGPAGSSCAKALGAAGIECLILEKKRLPRNKTCSGVIYGQSQELLREHFGALPPAGVRCDPEIINARNVLECKEDGSMERYVWELPKDGHAFSENWINVWRSKFDRWLLEESGARYMERTRFMGFERNGQGFTVLAKGADGKPLSLACDYLVGADGAASGVRKALDPEGAAKATTCVANYSYYEFEDMGDLEDSHWYVFLRPEFGDIIACIHRKDDTLAFSVGGLLGANLNDCERNFVQHLSDEYGVTFGKRRSTAACTLKLSTPCFGDGGLLLAGDASGINYLNGEAISAALDTGRRAGQAIAEAARNGGADPAADYKAQSGDILRHFEQCVQNMHFVVPK